MLAHVLYTWASVASFQVHGQVLPVPRLYCAVLGLACQALKLHNGGAFMVATSRVSSDLKWYRVVVSDGSPIGPDLRACVQAKNPDAALREVMRVQRIGF